MDLPFDFMDTGACSYYHNSMKYNTSIVQILREQLPRSLLSFEVPQATLDALTILAVLVSLKQAGEYSGLIYVGVSWFLERPVTCPCSDPACSDTTHIEVEIEKDFEILGVEAMLYNEPRASDAVGFSFPYYELSLPM
jgi:hypothetical protein